MTGDEGPTTNLDQRIAAALGDLVIGSAAKQFANNVPNSLNGVIVAEPGAGKTTGVPLALLNQPWLRDRQHTGIIMVEPRRVAARQAATRLASLLGQPLSQRLSNHDAGLVGLRMRDETHIGSRTRIEVVTDGVLSRLLTNDPELTGRSVVIFDEFHERSLDTDLGLALTLSARELFRPDLIVIVMSATLEAQRVSELLERSGGFGVERLHSPGRAYPVTVELRPGAGELAERVTQAVVESLAARAGDVLVFLPGIFEINRCARMLANHPALAETAVLALHARGNQQETAEALRPSRIGERRVVLSTSLAQTSVTIDGVTTVIDSGLTRRSVRDPDTGMSRLETTRVSRATAVQRAGRAGRTAPGHAIQLWSLSEASLFTETDAPEIASADLTGALMTAKVWGVEPTELCWVDPPSEQSWRQAHDDLNMLGALTATGSLTKRGRAMAEIPTEPRLAALLCLDRHQRLAAALAAYLSDTAWFGPGAPIDLRKQISTLTNDGSSDDLSSDLADGTRHRFRSALSKFIRGVAKHEQTTTGDAAALGLLALTAFPERLAYRANDAGHRYTFANGLTLPFAQGDIASLRGTPLLVAIDVNSDRRNGMIRTAVAVSADDIREWIGDRDDSWFFRLALERIVEWTDDRLEAKTVTQLVSELGEIPIETRSVPISAHEIADAVNDRLQNAAVPLKAGDESSDLYARIRFANRGKQDCLNDAIHQWLVDTLPPSSPSFSLSRINTNAALRHWLAVNGQAHTLNQRFPTSITIGERQHVVRYDTDSGRPTVSIRVQDLFGAATSPTVDHGQLQLTIELLSPASRVVAVTDDLARFWTVGYPSVRTELRGRYPKHQWPENPLAAPPRRMNKA